MTVRCTPAATAARAQRSRSRSRATAAGVTAAAVAAPSSSHTHDDEAALHGRRAAAWLRVWDSASRTARARLLQRFLALHREHNMAVVERDLGAATPLFVARLTTCLQLTYKTPDVSARHTSSTTTTSSMSTCASLLLFVLQSLMVCLRGSPYMTQFVASGAVAALTDCLASRTRDTFVTPRRSDDTTAARGDDAAVVYVPLHVAERRAVVLLLLDIANAGRVHREMVAREGGVARLLCTLRRERDDEVASLLTRVLLLLAQPPSTVAWRVQSGLLHVLVLQRDAECAAAAATSTTMATTTRQQQRSDGDRSGESTTRDTAVAVCVTDEAVLHAVRALRTLQQQQQQQQRDDDDADALGDDAVPVVGLVCAHTGSNDDNNDDNDDNTDNNDDNDDALPRCATTVDVYVAALLHLVKHARSPRVRAEGSALLVLAAHNVAVAQAAVTACLDMVDDDMAAILDEHDDNDDNDNDNNSGSSRRSSGGGSDEAGAVAAAATWRERQRRQLCSGRVAVQILLSSQPPPPSPPLSPSAHVTRPRRLRVLLRLLLLRGAHMTLLKYLRLCDGDDGAAMVDCCRVLQLLARTAATASTAASAHAHDDDDDEHDEDDATRHEAARASAALWSSVSQHLCAVFGHSLYDVLLHDKVTREVASMLLRAARTAAARPVLAPL